MKARLAYLDQTYWQLVSEVKAAVNKQLEAARNDGAVGKSLEAEVTLYCDTKFLDCLTKIEQDLRFVLITSKVTLAPASEKGDTPESDVPGLFVAVSATSTTKCVRCWHHCEDVGSNASHPEVCGRCVENIEGNGEVRQYA